MKFYFLGTGSSYPTVKRGVSSLALQFENGSVWLFDSGEGTQIQLQKVPIACRRINKIFITHLHGDHLFGLPGLLCTISSQIGSADETTKEKDPSILDVFGPLGLRQFLYTSLSLSRSLLQMKLRVTELEPHESQFPEDWKDWVVDHSSPPCLHPSEVPGKIVKPTVDENGQVSWKLLDDKQHAVVAGVIHHRIPSFGFIIREKERPGTLLVDKLKALGLKSGPSYGQLKAGCSVTVDDGRTIHPNEVLGPSIKGRTAVICGDTSDASPLLPFVEECDVLVHEATHDNSLLAKATEFGHSTPSQAAEFCRRIGAKTLLLNHFSQRYSNTADDTSDDKESVNLLLRQAKMTLEGTEVNVLCAFDLLCFSLDRPKRSDLT